MGKEAETTTVTLDLGEVHGRWLDFDNTITEENGFPEDWAELPKFKWGDKVKIVRPLTDEETESYGYPEEMAACVGTVGTVLDHRFGNYEVKCPCLQRGPYYVWPESALELATDNSKETP